jgi:Crinkler effector protein N-terminal domain
MMLLVCSLVGQKRSAFAIEVDENKMVDALKKAIKKEKENYLKAIDADELQLFLAKKGDGKWLDSRAVEALTLDGDGHPVGFMHMDPSLWIKNPKNFGERFEFKEGKIHILVVVPGDLGKIPSQIEFLAESESTWSADMLSVSLFPTDEMMEDSIPGYQWSELNEKQCVQINKKVTLSILKIT